MNMINKQGLNGEDRSYIEYPKAIPQHEKSELIKEVRFDRYKYHCGEGDMWPLTWGNDDCIYAAAGDNKGSPLNLWKVSSYSTWGKKGADPSKLTNTNDWTIDLVNNLPVNPEIFCKNPIAPSIKPAGLLDINGRLYMAVQSHNYGVSPCFNRQQNLNGWIVYSDDGGVNWCLEATKTDFFTGRLASCHFLQYGKGYTDAPDKYVYAYFTADEDGYSYWENADYMLLGRVPVKMLLQREKWEFYCGEEDGMPIWSCDDNKAEPVFEYYKMTGENHVCYCKGLKRYLMGNYSFVDNELSPRPIHQMSWPEAYRSQLTLFEAENPWGPWKLFYRDDDWGTYGDYQPVFPTKWMSDDGRMLFLVSSGSWNDYNFVVQKVALKLKEDKDFPQESRYFEFK